jgi:hypothetical protein
MANQTPCILWNPWVHYYIHKCLPPVSILSQLNSVHTTTSHYLKIHLNVILPSTSVTGYENLSAISLCGDVSEEAATGSLLCTTSLFLGLGSSVGIAIDYGLDGPGIESRWGRDFLRMSRPALGPSQPPVKWVPGLSRGQRRPGRGADHPLPPSAEIKIEYSYISAPPLGPGWPVIE